MKTEQDYCIVSFDAWIMPDRPLEAVARVIGEIYKIPLHEYATDRFDEYPAFQMELEDTVFVRLLGVPPDIDRLVIAWPSEFDEKDRSYAICISCHAPLPCVLGNGFALPYGSPSEFLADTLEKLRSSGLAICKIPRPFVQVATEAEPRNFYED